MWQVIRNRKTIHQGKLSSLRRVKEQVCTDSAARMCL